MALGFGVHFTHFYAHRAFLGLCMHLFAFLCMFLKNLRPFFFFFKHFIILPIQVLLSADSAAIYIYTGNRR